jgi:hypothetical protein
MWEASDVEGTGFLPAPSQVPATPGRVGKQIFRFLMSIPTKDRSCWLWVILREFLARPREEFAKPAGAARREAVIGTSLMIGPA